MGSRLGQKRVGWARTMAEEDDKDDIPRKTEDHPRKVLGQALERTFRTYLNEPVPKRLQDLIAKIREAEREKKNRP